MATEWREPEIVASVEEYGRMLQMQNDGVKFVKKRIYQDLESQFDQSWKSFEYFMQNISHVIHGMGGEFVRGLKPKQNIAAHAKPIVEREILRLGLLDIGNKTIQPSTTWSETPEELEQRVDSLLDDWSNPSVIVKPPAGLSSPPKTESNKQEFKRCPEVKAWVLRASGGCCEACGEQAPFITAKGKPGLDVHHVKTLAEGGPDIVENTVAVCPNCHRALHHSADRERRAQSLYDKVARLER